MKNRPVSLSERTQSSMAWMRLAVCAFVALAAARAAAQVTDRPFAATTAITIADGVPASPYPSVITVNGLPGVVSRVTVSLVGLSHAFPDDLDVLLVAPNNRAVLLMSDCGGGTDLNNATLTFDDAALASLPNSTAITPGVYKPTNYDPSGAVDTFPFLAFVDYVPTLSGLNGVFPNGDWSLYVVDDAGSDAGVMAGGWLLTLSTVDPVTAADLAVGIRESRDPATTDEKLVYTVSVTNLGPNPAFNVVLTDVLAPTLDVLFVTPSQGSCAVANQVVTCDLANLANGAVATVLIGTAPTVAGVVTNSAGAVSSGADFFPDNSTAVETTTLTDAAAIDLVVTMTDTPDPAILAQNLSYTVTVRNRGPLDATDVVLTDVLPPNSTLVSATPSQGSCLLSAGDVVCALGDVTNGGVATLLVVLRPALLGTITNRATVTASEFDINAGNDTASETTGVYVPTDVSVRQSDSVDPASVGSNLTYTVFVYNSGPGTATGVTLSNLLPQAAAFISAVPDQGSCALVSGEVVMCDLGDLPATATTRVLITVRPGVLGTFINTATAYASESDSNPGNNSSRETTTVYPGGNGIVITPSTNALELANAITASGSTGIRVKSTRLQAHADTNFFFGGFATSSGLYSVANPPFTYGLQGLGVVMSSGDVLDYQTGGGSFFSGSTSYGVRATTNQEALLDPITASGNRTFTHYDVTQLDIEFDLLPGFDTVLFNVVFGSDEYPEFVNSSFVDGFGIYLNGVNIAFTGGRPVNINHPDMRAISGTQLDGVLAPGGNPIMTFTKFIGDGATNNRLTFIVSDTSDSVLDTTVYVSSLQGILPPNADLALSLAGPAGGVTVGSNVTYRVTVTNLGPDIASETTVTNLLPANATFIAAVPSQGSCTFLGDQVICDLFNVDPGSAATVTITVVPTEEGFLTHVASVRATQIDFGDTNNAATNVALALEYGNFLSTAAIIVNDGAPATPYPAVIIVSNVSGVITQVAVTLKGLTHAFPADLDILLVGPSGQAAILMSDAGANFGVNNLTVTFDDRAAQALPRNGPVTNGVWRPANYSPADTFYEPAPAGATNAGASLGVFNGTDPNGLWQLFIVDDLGQDAGVVAGGWSLTLDIGPAGNAPAGPPPRLQIARSGAQAVLTWPQAAGSYELEAITDVGTTVPWGRVTNAVTVVGTNNSVTVDVAGSARFFRLKQTSP